MEKKHRTFRCNKGRMRKSAVKNEMKSLVKFW